MRRRDFLRLPALWGLGSMLGTVLGASSVQAANGDYQGPLWLCISADGGWDPTSFCDPKGYDGLANAGLPERINNYDKNNIAQVGPFALAPPPDSFQPGGVDHDPTLYLLADFFKKYTQQLLVINGIDVQTNSHENALISSWGGRLVNGYPSFAALASGSLAPKLPLTYMANAGYAYTAGLVVPVSINGAGVNTMFEIAFPNRSAALSSPTAPQYLANEAMTLLDQAMAARVARLRDRVNLPKVDRALARLATTANHAGGLQGFATNLADTAAARKTLDDFSGRKVARTLYEHGRVILAAYETGICVAGNLGLGGFDTHSHHDAQHYPRLTDLFMAVDAILDEAVVRGLSDRLVVVIGSEMARTNKYNETLGKDHWPITSMLFMGNSTQTIQGNRIIGATTAEQRAININPQTLALDIEQTLPGSVRLTPQHIHQNLRELAGISTTSLALRYPLEGAPIRLFG